MLVSQKCQYAVRAVFEIAKHWGNDLTTLEEIAGAQAIPISFLGVILSQLRQAGLISSKRGAEGGYLLARSPDKITVGDVIRLIEGPPSLVRCLTDDPADDCAFASCGCVFKTFWQQCQQALDAVYEGTTYQDLLEEDARRRSAIGAASYMI